MIKKMLISTNKSNEIKVALLENKKLSNLEVENEKNKYKKGNIYKAIITKFEPGLNALFINYGASKDGFLPFKEISQDYLTEFHIMTHADLLKDSSKVIGYGIIIQIEKEEREEKGAALTTYFNLAGCYLVLISNNSIVEGVSKYISGENRYDLKEKLNYLSIPKNFGIIVRTSGIGRNIEELKWEANILVSQFKIIKYLSFNKESPFLIYEDGNLIIKTIRDYLKSDVKEILIDNINIFNLIYKYLIIIKSDFSNRVKLYYNIIPLFVKYKIEYQIELIFKREVFLESGGSLSIDNVEALTSIDINSARFNRCDDIEETALQTNLEAIDEIGRQLRIRDLGGLIIIDFIDIDDSISKELIEKKLIIVLSLDKAKIQIGKISKFGLLEISRQRLKSSLIDDSQYECYKCKGTGKINNIENISIIILKALEEEVIKSNIYQIHIELPIKMLIYMINIKKHILLKMEQYNNIKIILIANKVLSIPDYKIYKFKNNKKIKFLKKKEINLSNIYKYLYKIGYNIVLNNLSLNYDDHFLLFKENDYLIIKYSKNNTKNKNKLIF